MAKLPKDPHALAELKRVLEERKAAFDWRCAVPDCNGEPHDGKQVRHARSSQRPPWGETIILPDGTKQSVRRWYLRGGRGSGKTWAGAHALAEIILYHGGTDENGDQRQYGIVGPDFGHAKQICMEGVSGLLAALGGEYGDHVRQYNRSSGELHMNNGAIVYTAGADSFARKIEGTNLTAIWTDEVGLWSVHRWQRTWEQAITFAVRKDPSLFIITGTPKQGHPLVQKLAKDPSVKTVVMSTMENRALDPKQVAELKKIYEGTRLGRQELEGEVLLDTPGALWTASQIEANRFEYPPTPDELIRIVVAWDPAVTSGDNSDEHGVIVAGQIPGDPAEFVVLEDGSGRYTPMEAVNKVQDLYAKWGANTVVAETNNGGDMIEALLRTGTAIIPLMKVTATRGKRLRAEPVASLSEQGKLHLVGAFPKLEDQMTTWSPESPGSPDRLDAMVWAITALQEKSATSRAYVGKNRISVRSR